MLRFTLLACALFFFSGITSFSAGVPNTVNYQGRLTDAAGDVVPDGAILVKFQIYDAATGGTVLWNSTFQSVNVSNGLFSYDLGSNVTLPDLFSADTVRYLGITVGTDPEISPRTRFTSNGYVFEAQKSDIADIAMNADSLGGQHPSYYLDWANMANVPAGFADGVDDIGMDQTTADGRYVNLTGDTITGDLQLRDVGGVLRSRLYANVSKLDLFSPGNFGAAALAALDTDGGLLLLLDSVATRTIQLRGNFSGDNAVMLPSDAINSNEILDEPGIVAQQTSGNVILTNTSMQDIKTVTITIPSDGYIVVNANIVGYINTSTGRSYGVSQIDETSGGSNTGGQDHWWGGPHVATYQTVPHMRVYFKTAGTYTFRLEAMTSYTSGANGARIIRCWMMATYYPTSYGSVTTVAGNPGDNPTAKAVSMTGPDGTVSTGYEMDLRYYEEKARTAEIAAQKAELEKIQAQTDLERARHGSNGK